ncbi:uncharacterized protein [Aquarana catesbeiana]|uniref:uncharacterized protein isoform X2 n=1 Tax=Aquarana catesbeiana TaxID=8400 RepID=UPI003CC973E7
MGIFHLLSILSKAFCKILSLCSMAWNPFFWCKITWRFLLQFSQEVSSSLIFGQNSATEEDKQKPSLENEVQQSDGEELKKELKRMQDISSTSISRLYTFEEKVGKLESDLSGEKELWRTRYQELFEEQQALKEQERCNLTESTKCENPGQPSFDNTDGIVETSINGDDVLRRRLGDPVNTCTHPCKDLRTIDGYKNLEVPSSFTCCSALESFSVSFPSRMKSHRCFRVFVPNSPMDLKVGSRVKVILPCGKVGTGAVCKIGQLPGKVEFQVGVVLELQQPQHQPGDIKGQSKVSSDSCSHVIIPFSKVLMVWE